MAAATSMAVSRPAPIAHHQKKTNTGNQQTEPKPYTEGPHPRRPRPAGKRCIQPRPTRPESTDEERQPAQQRHKGTTSISANLCPGLIGTNTGPSSRAGTANSTKARANRIAHPCSHLIALPLPQLGRDDGKQPHSADLTEGGSYQSAAPS